MGFMTAPNRVFRSSPHAENEPYINWLNKVESKKGGFWKDQGIFDLIQLSRYGPKYHSTMLIAALHFWELTTNSLHLKCGMLTPTLLDVAAITGLKPTGETFNPSNTTNSYQFDFKRATFSGYIEDQHVTDSNEVSDIEHIAFLTLWLSSFIFCSSSLQVAKMYVNLAIQLHEGRNICLSKLILGALYEALGNGAFELRGLQPGAKLLISGPIWLFQLWLLATFESRLQLYIPDDYLDLVNHRRIEGTRLVVLRFREIGQTTEALFSSTFDMLLHCDRFTPSMAPFVNRLCGPTWYTKEFPATSVDEEEEVNPIWQAFLTPSLLSTRISPGKGKNQFGLSAYQPNLVARQFGLCQPRPRSFYKSKKDMKNPETEREYWARLDTDARNAPTLIPFKFEHTFACTKAFFKWWVHYYKTKSADVEEATLLSNLISGFSSSQNKKTKSKGTHIQEIEAFQKYFETVYDPTNLSRTVFQAARVLKQKLIDKLPTMVFPPYVSDRYSFALTHNKIKFPPLPTSKLALAFRPPLPQWLVCGSTMALGNFLSNKAAEKIVPTKYDIYTFEGHLHLDIQHVRVTSTIATGDEQDS